MTLARDIRTGAVVGQVNDRALLADLERYGHIAGWRPVEIQLLTRNGYVTVPRSSVRLEEISDR